MMNDFLPSTQLNIIKLIVLFTENYLIGYAKPVFYNLCVAIFRLRLAKPKTLHFTIFFVMIRYAITK